MFSVKLALKLNNREATLMAKHAGFRRVVFNMGLSLRTQMYSEGKFSDSKVINEVKKVLTDRVKKQPEFAWMNQLSSRVYQNALIDLKMRLADIAQENLIIPHLHVVEISNRLL